MAERTYFVKRKMQVADHARLSGNAIPLERVEGSGPPNRHGMPKLPPGQREVTKWPVLDLGIQPDVPKENWTLTVSGAVANPFVLDWEAFMDMPQVEDMSDFHCVTTWSRMDNRWIGVAFRDIATRAQLSPNAGHVYITGYDDYSTNLKIEEAMDPDVLLVHTWEGAPLSREHGGPVRMIVPRKYAWKGAKWIKEIVFLQDERKGFWEDRGYSNSAEPWYNDRFDLASRKLPS